MKYLVSLFVLFFAAHDIHAACRAIAQNTDGGERVESLATMGANVREADDLRKKVNDVYGSDLAYQGGNCPDGKICVETVFTAYPSMGVQGVHGQVVILNPETGAVDGLAPIRFRDQGEDQGQPFGVSGIPPKDRSRWDRICSAIDGQSMSTILDARLTPQRRQQNAEYEAARPYRAVERQRTAEFCRGNDNGERRAFSQPDGSTNYTSVDGPDLLDLYYYGASPESTRDSAASAPGEEPRGNPLGASFYKNFNAGAKLNVIQDLNRPSGARVAPSRNQPSGGGTVTLLRQRVDAVRAALGCPVSSEVATTASLADYTRGPASSRDGLPYDAILTQLSQRNVRRAIDDCRVDIRENGSIRFRQYSGYSSMNRVEVPINDQSCTRTYSNDGTETISCSLNTTPNRSTPLLARASSSASVTIRVRNGRVVSLQRSNPKSEPGHRGTCSVSEPSEQPRRERRRRGRTNS